MLLIKNASLHTGLAPAQKLDVLVEGKSFSRLAPVIDPADCPPACTVLDAQGKHIFPGFINAYCQWGIMGPGWSGDDQNENSQPLTPDLDVTFAFDQDGMNFQKVYDYGVTSAVVGPAPNSVLAGRAAAYKTFGKSPYDMLIQDQLALAGSVSEVVKKSFESRQVRPSTRMGIFALLRQALRKAQTYQAEKEDYDPISLSLQPVVTGQVPLLINLDFSQEMEALILALEDFPQIKLVLMGAYGFNLEIYQILKEAGREVKVIFGDVTECINRANKQLAYEEIIPLFASEDLAISTAGSYPTGGKESLLWNALQWRRHGLSKEAALKAISLTPAKIFGLDGEIGSIEEGKTADFSIWSGDPFESYQAKLESVFIAGQNPQESENRVSCW